MTVTIHTIKTSLLVALFCLLWGQTTLVSASPNTATANNDAWMFAFGFHGALRSQNDADANFDYLTGSQSSKGDFNDNTFGLGLEGLLYFPRPTRFLPSFLSLSGTWHTSSNKERAAFGDFHPLFGAESYLALSVQSYYKIMLGFELIKLQQMTMYLMGGMQYTNYHFNAITNESGGGGNLNKITKEKGMFSPVLGARFKYPLWNTVRAYMYGDLLLNFRRSMSQRFTTQPFGLDYKYKLDSGIEPEVRFGIIFPIP